MPWVRSRSGKLGRGCKSCHGCACALGSWVENVQDYATGLGKNCINTLARVQKKTLEKNISKGEAAKILVSRRDRDTHTHTHRSRQRHRDRHRRRPRHRHGQTQTDTDTQTKRRARQDIGHCGDWSWAWDVLHWTLAVGLVVVQFSPCCMRVCKIYKDATVPVQCPYSARTVPIQCP